MLVGNAKAFIPQLRSLGLTDVEIIPVDQLDLMSASLKRSWGGEFQFELFGPVESSKRSPRYTLPNDVSPRATQVKPAPAAARQLPRRRTIGTLDLLRRVVDARGGLMALKAIRTVVAETITTFQMQQGTLPSTTRTYIVYPDKFRVDAEDQRHFPDDSGLQLGPCVGQDPGRNSDAPPAMTADFAASVRRDIIPLLIDAAEGRLTVRGRPIRPPATAARAGARDQRREARSSAPVHRSSRC